RTGARLPLHRWRRRAAVADRAVRTVRRRRRAGGRERGQRRGRRRGAGRCRPGCIGAPCFAGSIARRHAAALPRSRPAMNATPGDAEDSPSPPLAPVRPRASTALVVLATIAVGFTLWAAQGLLLP